MKPQLLAKLIPATLKVIPMIKSAIWSDGKFNLQRAIVLLVAMTLLGFGFYYIPEYMAVMLDSLDEVSDIIGHDTP